MELLKFQYNVIQAVEKLNDINEIRKLERELGLSEFQIGQLSGAQQTLSWLVRGFMEPVRAILTDQQLAQLPPFCYGSDKLTTRHEVRRVGE